MNVFNDYLLSSASGAAINSVQRAVDFAAVASSQKDRQPTFGSRAEAIGYLQAEKFRPHEVRRTHQVHAAPHAPYSRRIALVVRKENGKEIAEVLHATKGWKRVVL